MRLGKHKKRRERKERKEKTDRVNERRKIRRIRFIVRFIFVGILPSDIMCHQAQGLLLVLQFVQRKFKIGRGDEPDEHPMANDGKSAVDLSCIMKAIQLAS